MKGSEFNQLKRILPKGTWVRFHDLAPGSTDEEIQELIAHRTGVQIPIDRISTATRFDCVYATISLDWSDVSDIVAWALSDDTLRGRPINIVKPGPKAA
jgi:hypothetical protein